MDSEKACYTITINTKVATNSDVFTLKALELEDCLNNWLSIGWAEQYTVNCDLERSSIEYDITAELDVLVAKMVFMLAPKDETRKVEMLKPKMRACFMEASNNLFPTCAFTKKQAC